MALAGGGVTAAKVTELFALTEPMVPLCRPDCPGLCAECGERLDRGDHEHDAGEIDPRLASLAALLPDEDPNRRN